MTFAHSDYKFWRSDFRGFHIALLDVETNENGHVSSAVAKLYGYGFVGEPKLLYETDLMKKGGEEIVHGFTKRKQ